MRNYYGDTDTLPLRHPDNSNLHLHYGDTFEGLPVMIDKGKFIWEHLFKLKRTIELAMAEYPRVLAFRVDLNLPQGIDLPVHAYRNQVISRFIASFKARINFHQQLREKNGKTAHGCRVRYVWAREVAQEGRQHYHLLILLNLDAYYTVGRLTSQRENHVRRMEKAWASALRLRVDQVSGLVNIPEKSEWRLYRKVRPNKRDRLPDLFFRTSYLCKFATKRYGDRQRSFDASRG